MSDVFNTTVNKQQISQLLFGKDPIDESITTESFLHPPQPNKTSSTGDSAERRAEFIINHRIPAFHPKLLSENVEIPYEELQLSGNFNKYVEALHESYQTRLSEGRTYPYKDPGVLVLPEGDKLVLPYYKPLYKNGRYDEKILNQVVFESLYNKIGEHNIKDGFILNRTRIVDTDHATMTVREVRAAAAEYILSTGTWKGQLSRLRAMHDVRHGLKGNFAPKTLAQLNLSLEDFSIILQDTLPIQPIEEDPDMLPLMYKPSQYIVVDGDEFIDTLPKLKIKSKAGPPFPSRLKKGDIYTSSIFMADYILTRISEEVKKPTGARDFSSILKEEPWLAMGFGFPKEERYRRDQLETKTRNIFSASTVTHLLNSMITDPIMSKSNYNLASKDSVTPSLQKFTPYFGNLTTFLNHMLDETRTTDAIYADNWYVSWLGNDGKKRYYSLDLIKGEAQATPDMAAAVGYYLLTRGWVTEDNYVAFSKTWAAYALKVMPACVVDSIFVWYNFQLRFPGQGSGNTFTYIINQATTSKFRYFWKKAGEPCPSLDGVTFTPEFTKVMEQTGVNWQIELYHRDLMQEVIDVATETPTEGFLQDDTPLSLDEHGQSTYGKRLPRLRLDILGYDAVYSNKLESFIPVLAWDRLLPSVLWPKKEEDDIKDPLVYRMYRLLRYEVLRFMGGFTDPILDQALGSIAAEIRKFFQERGLATAYDLEAFGEVDDLAPALLELFDTMGKQVRLDSNFYLSAEMISSLNTPKDTPNRLAKNPVPAHLRKLRVSLDTFSRGARTTRFQDLSVTIKRLSAELYSQKTITNLGDPKRLREMAIGLVNQNLKDRTGSASIVNALDGFEKIIDLVIEYSSEGAKKFDVEKEERLQRDVTLAYNELLDKVLKATRKSSEAIESLLMTDPQAQIYTDYLKNSAELANPTLGYSGAIGHARVPKPRLEGLTKSQKKNLKKRTKTRELKEKMAQ